VHRSNTSSSTVATTLTLLKARDAYAGSKWTPHVQLAPARAELIRQDRAGVLKRVAGEQFGLGSLSS